MILIPIVTGAIGVYQTLLSNQVGQRVMHDLRTSVYRHLQRLSLAFFTRTRTGDVQSGSRTTSAAIERRHVDGDFGRLERDDGDRHRRRDVPARLAARSSRCLLPLFVWLTRRVGEQRKKVTAERQESLADVSLDRAGVALGLRDPAREDDGPLRRPRGAVLERVRRLADLEVRSRMTGRWMMAAIQMTFAVMPALVYWFAGWHRRTVRSSLGDTGRLHDAADAAVLPDRLAARGPARGAELAGALRPDLRLPRPADRHRRGHAGAAIGRAATSPSTPSVSATTTTPGRCRTSRSRFPPGTKTALVGETGSGKTTCRLPRRATLRRDPRAASRSTASTCAS